MAATKTLRTLQSSASSAANAGDQTTSTSWNLTTAYGGTMTIKITNGSTGPTVAAYARVEISGDDSAYKTFTKVTGDSVNSSVNQWSIDIPPGVMYARVVFGGNTAQAVTVEAFGQELTTI